MTTNFRLTTPVLFLVFNRPDYTKAVFTAIKEAKPAKLFIGADGPRENNPDDYYKCQEVKKIFEQIDWDCEVNTLFRKENLGSQIAESGAINWFFDNVDRGIILEDDCLPHSSFFKFAEEMLEKYKNQENIMMISGNNYLPEIKTEDGYFFSRYFSTWGWATWKRAWKKYDVNMESWENPLSRKKIKKMYSQKYMSDYMSDAFDKVHDKKIDAWDFQWSYACLLNDGLSIVPKVNLISNIGMVGTNANAASSKINQNLPTFDVYKEGPLRHPKSIYPKINYDNTFYKINFKQKILKKLRSNIVSTLKKFKTLRKIYALLIRAKVYFFGYGICKNVNNSRHLKNCLFLFITKPFKSKSENFHHQHYWQAKEVARIIGEFGYNVDVVNFDDKRVKLHKSYDMVMDMCPNPLNIYNKKLKKDHIKISYITGANPIFSNKEEEKRLDNLHKRRGFKIKPRRQGDPFEKEYFKTFDSMIFMGNKAVLETYKGETPANTYRMPNIGYPFLNNISCEQRSPKNFLFLSGPGHVHKGLDLLLEVFSRNKDLHLYVCSNLMAEKDFCELYKKELFETPNIHPIGFIDTNSSEFVDLASKCAYIISPSCSDAITGSVVTGISAGLIPIVSKESGFDETEAHLLKDCELNTISGVVQDFSLKPKDWIYRESQKFIDISNDKFSKNNFSNSIRKALSDTINRHDNTIK